jgi:hypothetical protein
LPVEFLHVVCLSPRNAAFSPSQVNPIDDAARTGVTFGDRQGQRWAVVFHRGAVGLIEVKGER